MVVVVVCHARVHGATGLVSWFKRLTCHAPLVFARGTVHSVVLRPRNARLHGYGMFTLTLGWGTGAWGARMGGLPPAELTAPWRAGESNKKLLVHKFNMVESSPDP